MVFSDKQLFEKVVEILKPLDLSVVDYEEICDRMGESMRLGLQKSTNEKSSIKMFPSYVTRTPNGTGILTLNVLYLRRNWKFLSFRSWWNKLSSAFSNS